MNIGKWLLVKHEGKIIKGIVIEIFQEDLKIKLEGGITIIRKFWEVRKIDEKKED